MALKNIILLISTLFINLFGFYLLFKDKKIKETDDEGKALVSKRFITVYSIGFIVLNIAIVFFFTYMYSADSLVFSLKRFAVLSLLWPIALIDFKTYRIPNVFILTGLIYRLILIIPEFFLDREYLLGNLIAEVVAAVAISIAAFLCSIVSKNSIGYGDIKLFIVMGLLLGMDGIWGSIFMSLIVSFFCAVFLLITKKKGRKDVIPFAPSIMIGTYISVILTGM